MRSRSSVLVERIMQTEPIRGGNLRLRVMMILSKLRMVGTLMMVSCVLYTSGRMILTNPDMDDFIVADESDEDLKPSKKRKRPSAQPSRKPSSSLPPPPLKD